MNPLEGRPSAGALAGSEGREDTHDPLVDLRRKLEPFDPVDLLATAGALELLPENAERALRLQAFAQVAASLQIRQGLNRISVPRLRQFLSGPELTGLAHGEDPFPNAFVEEVPFFGGSYAVFPGTASGVAYTFRMLSRALFRDDSVFRSESRHLFSFVTGVLRLSHEMVRRAGLHRGADPKSQPSGPIIIPSGDRLNGLKNAVSFTREEMEAFFGPGEFAKRPWDRLTSLAGSVSAEGFSFEDSPLMLQPIIQAGNTFVVPCPESLLTVLNHHVVAIALEHLERHEFVEAYCHQVSLSVALSMRYLGMTSIRYKLPNRGAIPGTRERLFRCDVDKAVFALVIPDTLRDFQSELGSGGMHRTPDLAEQVRDRVREVEEDLYASMPGLNELLCLVVLGGVGRPHILGFGKVTTDAVFEIFPAHELETFALLEGGNSLALWRFSRESERLHHRMMVQSWSPLDEFGLYRRHHHSFYLSDDQPPDVLNLTTDFSGELHREVIRTRDWQAVPNYDGNGVVEVTTLHGNRKIPIYIPSSLFSSEVAVFVDNLPFPLWVVAVKEEHHGKSRSFYAELASSLAYWLWHCSDSLTASLRDRPHNPELIRIELSLPAEEEWGISAGAPKTGSENELIVTNVDQNTRTVRLSFQPGISSLFNTGNNYGERHCLRCMLCGLRDILQVQDRLTNAQITSLIDRVAPLGLKKMVFLLDMRRLPELDPRGIPHYRPVQEGDVEDVLDRLGKYLRENCNLQEGPIPDADRNDVLKEAVGFCYRELQQIVRAHHSEGFVEFLIREHEAVVRENAYRKLTIPTRIACFEMVEDIVQQLQEEFPKIAVTALASRFLIEYAATEPPAGLRPISLGSYDEMRALANHIINFGLQSDAVKYELSDMKFAMLRSGRLGRTQGSYEGATATHMRETMTDTIAQSPETFSRNWRTQDTQKGQNEVVRTLDVAALAEFGFTMSEISELTGAIQHVGEEVDPGVAAVRRDELVEQIVGPLGWPRQRVLDALTLFSLGPRRSFLDAPPGATVAEVYPWRFNRAFSYLRRPLIAREGPGGPQILWGNRHVETVHENLLGLCLGGRLKAHSDAMRAFISQLRNKQGRDFNDSVADTMQDRLGFVVTRRVKKIGRLRLDNLGDIDVLAADVKTKRVIVVETKDLSVARTPSELVSEVTEFVHGYPGKRSVIAKHQDRVLWVKEHLPDVLSFLGIQTTTRWPGCFIYRGRQSDSHTAPSEMPGHGHNV
jgi:hypothetical protein